LNKEWSNVRRIFEYVVANYIYVSRGFTDGINFDDNYDFYIGWDAEDVTIWDGYEYGYGASPSWLEAQTVRFNEWVYWNKWTYCKWWMWTGYFSIDEGDDQPGCFSTTDLPPQSCSFRYDGEQKTIKHGGSWTFKPYYTAMDANYCSEITATCYDGEMKVN
jgi:hypothetical protein